MSGIVQHDDHSTPGTRSCAGGKSVPYPVVDPPPSYNQNMFSRSPPPPYSSEIWSVLTASLNRAFFFLGMWHSIIQCLSYQQSVSSTMCVVRTLKLYSSLNSLWWSFYHLLDVNKIWCTLHCICAKWCMIKTILGPHQVWCTIRYWCLHQYLHVWDKPQTGYLGLLTGEFVRMAHILSDDCIVASCMFGSSIPLLPYMQALYTIPIHKWLLFPPIWWT